MEGKAGNRSKEQLKTKTFPIRISQAEFQTISESASKARMSAAAYLRALGLGYTPASRFDELAIISLCRSLAALSDQAQRLREAASLPPGSVQVRLMAKAVKDIDSTRTTIAEMIKLLSQQVHR